MPEHQLVLYSLLGVALILIAVVAFNNLQARKEATAGGSGSSRATGQGDGPSTDAFMLKFVRHGGDVVGETVAHADGMLILKQAGVFKSVPLDLAELQGDEIVLRGDIDWDDAVARGTAWQEAKTSGSDPTVSGDLTRSEDVRKPALEALKDKERQERAAMDEDEGDPSSSGATEPAGEGDEEE